MYVTATITIFALAILSTMIAGSQVPITCNSSAKAQVRWHKELWGAIAKALVGLWFIITLFAI